MWNILKTIYRVNSLKSNNSPQSDFPSKWQFRLKIESLKFLRIEPTLIWGQFEDKYQGNESSWVSASHYRASKLSRIALWLNSVSKDPIQRVEEQDTVPILQTTSDKRLVITLKSSLDYLVIWLSLFWEVYYLFHNLILPVFFLGLTYNLNNSWI